MDRTKIDGMLQIHLLKRHRFESLSVFKKTYLFVYSLTGSDLPQVPHKSLMTINLLTLTNYSY